MMFKKIRIYLDFAAAAPASDAALAAFNRAIAAFGNPSSPHAEGRLAKDVLEDARVRIARLAGVKQDAVIFTAGATDVCCRLAMTPVSASDSDAKASLRVEIGPRSEISSRIFARCLPPCSNRAETRLPEAWTSWPRTSCWRSPPRACACARRSSPKTNATGSAGSG